MKKIKRIIAVLLVAVLLMGSFSVFASAVSVSTTKTDYGYMVPTDSKFSKVLSKVTLYGDYDYLNFYINSEYDDTYFFYEIYSDKKCTEVVATDFVQCDSGSYTFSPLLKLKGVFKSGTYYCITYSASINSSTGAVKLSTPSVVSFEITVKRTATFNQLMVPLKTATSTINGPKITWSKLSSTDVKYYYIYRRNINSSSWTKVGSVSSSTTSFTDTSTKNKNGNYVYTVKAVDKNGNATRYHYGGVECLFVATPTVQSVSTTADNQIQIKWNSTGADRYRLYRKTNGGDWELLSSNISGSNSTYTDYKVVSGNNYEYTVRAGKYFDDDYILSSYNTGKSVDYVAAPKLKPVTVAETGLDVEWEAVEGATAYTVYRKPLDSEESWTKLQKVSAETLTYNDTTADSQGMYTYTVRAEGTTSRGSYLSAGVDYLILQQPDFTLTIIDENNYKLHCSKVPYATEYVLYKKGSDGKWQEIGTTSTGYLSASGSDVSNKLTNNKFAEIEFAVSATRNGLETDYENNVKKVFYNPKTWTYCSVYSDYNYVSWSDTSTGIYNLYRKIKGTDDSEYQLIYSGEKTNYKDTDVEYDVGYTYLAKAVFNSVEQSEGVYPKSITRYRVDDYIESFKVIEKFTSETTSYYDFSYGLKDAAEGMKTRIYCYEVFGTSVGWDSIDTGVTNSKYYTPATEEAQFSLLVYDGEGSTPVDGYITSVKNEKCNAVDLKYEAVKNGLKFYWNAVDGAVEYRLISADSGSIDKTVVADGSDSYSVIIDPSELTDEYTHSFRIEAVHSNGNKTVTALSDIPYTDEIPRILMVVSTDNGVLVDWEDNCTYVVFRKAPGDTSWSKLGSARDRYIDKTAKKDVAYTYTLRAYSSKYKCYTTYYDTKGLSVGQIATPKLLSTRNTESGVIIEWENMFTYYDVNYNIYRRTEKTDWVKIGTNYAVEGMAKNSWSDRTVESGKTYYYTVRAFTGSNISNYDKTGISADYIATPSLTSATNTANGIKVVWGKVTGAKGYYIYRKTSNTDWKRLGEVSGTSFTDKTVKSGTTYYYTVRAYSGSSVSSYVKKGISVKCLATPVLSSATNATSGVTVNWGKVTGAGGYYVYRKTASSGWSKIATVSSGSTVSYKDTTAQAGVTYTYTVRAYSGSTASYFDEGGVTVKRLTTPSLTSATRSSSGITVKWSKVTGASGYYIYRKTANSGWAKVGTVKSGSTVSYKDTTAKSGTTYYYTVKAYSGSSVSAHVSSGIKCK